MAYEIKQNVIDPVRMGFDWVERRLGRPANRYEEASIEVQQEENFHYRPLWDPDHEIFDRSYTKLDLGDTYGFTDPRQYFYFSYNQARSKSSERFIGQLNYAQEVGAFQALPIAWRTTLADVVAPLRHLEYGFQLVLLQVSGFSWGTTIEQAACFSAFDHIGNAQLFSRLLLGLDDGTGVLARAKELWMTASWLQPARRFIEDILVESDWGDQFVAVQLAMAPRLYAALMGGLERAAVDSGHGLLAPMFHHFVEWYVDDSRWSGALVEHLLAVDGSRNRELVTEALGRFDQSARNAVEGIASACREVISPEEMVALGEAAAEVAQKSLRGVQV